LDTDCARAIFNSVDNLLAVGFTVNAPEAKEGEIIEEIGWVVARQGTNRAGHTIYVLSMYVNNEALIHPKIKVYLDTPELENQFEHVSGLRLRSLPIYEGEGNISRASGVSSKYIIQAPRPFRVAFERNPLFNPDEPDISKRKPQFRFTRFVDAPTGKASENDKATDNDSIESIAEAVGATVTALDEKPAPSGKVWTTDDAMAWAAEIRQTFKGVDPREALEVERLGQWKGDTRSATARVQWFARQHGL
jgi:hypothetical protein